MKSKLFFLFLASLLLVASLFALSTDTYVTPPPSSGGSSSGGTSGSGGSSPQGQQQSTGNPVTNYGQTLGIRGSLTGDDFTCKKLSNQQTSIVSCVPTGDNPNLVIGGNIFSNIQNVSSRGGQGSSFQVDSGGNLEKANFFTNNRGGTYVFGDQRVNVPANSQVIFDKKNGVKILAPSGSSIKTLPEKVSRNPTAGTPNYPVTIQGENVKLPNGYTLQRGAIRADNGRIYVPQGGAATINGFDIKATSTPVDLRFGSGPYWGFGSESGNFVRFDKGKAKFQGTGFEVRFNPELFSVANTGGDFASFSFANSKNKKYYQVGDRGPEVKKIQKLLGIEQTGEFDSATREKVIAWQRENGLTVDGKFGSGSLRTARNSNSGTFTRVVVDGTVLVSNDNGRVKIDSQGGSVITTGQSSFRVANDGQVMKKVKRGATAGANSATQINGVDSSGRAASRVGQSADGNVVDENSQNFGGLRRVRDRVDSFTRRAASEPFQMIDRVASVTGFKERSPYAAEFFNHYLSGGGSDVNTDFPQEWQDWVIAQTRGRPAGTYELSPYDSGIYDLRNTMGHFKVTVRQEQDGTRTYDCTDIYDFGYYSQDRSQRGRHGFGLGNLADGTVSTLNRFLPSTEYQNPGGFTERVEIKTLGGETYLLIPRELLRQQGTPFNVRSTFRR